MRILYFLPYVPFPTNRGTFQRTFHLCRELAQHHEVDLFCLAEGDLDSHREARDVFSDFCGEVHFHPFAHPPWASLLSRLVDPVPTTIRHWYQTDVQAELQQLVDRRQYDLIHFVDLVLWPYVEALNFEGKKVMDRSRVDLSFQQDEYARLTFSWKERLLRKEVLWKLEAYEKKVARQLDCTVVCGEDDATFLRENVRRSARIRVIPNGFDPDYFSSAKFPRHLSQQPSLVFCGTLDYVANIQALEWYFQEIDPLVLKQVPHRTVEIVGLNPVDRVRELANREGVALHANVPDVRPYYQSAWLQIVPIQIGGGTRLKIIESMGIQCPVVSTSIGAQGLGYLRSGVDLIRADSPECFASEVIQVLETQAQRKQLEQSGHKQVLQYYTWQGLGAGLARQYERLTQPELIGQY